MFVFVIDPVVPGADYSLGKILVEAFPDPAKLQEIWKLYTGSVTGGGSLVNLTPGFGDRRPPHQRAPAPDHSRRRAASPADAPGATDRLNVERLARRSEGEVRAGVQPVDRAGTRAPAKREDAVVEPHAQRAEQQIFTPPPVFIPMSVFEIGAEAARGRRRRPS